MAINPEKLNTNWDHNLKCINGIWHYKFNMNGMIYEGTCKTGSKRDAQRLLDHMKYEVHCEWAGMRSIKQVTFKDAYELYLQVMPTQNAEKTIANMASSYKKYFQSFKDQPITKMQTAVDTLHLKLIQQGKKPGTISTIFNRIKSIMEFARLRGLHTFTPIYPKVCNPRAPKAVLDNEEIGLFFDCLEEVGSLDHNIMIRAMYFLGLRQGEAVAMTWDNYDAEHLVYTIDKQKNGKITQQPVPQEMAEFFSYKERRPGELICPGRNGKVRSYDYTGEILEKISKMMELKKPITHHRLRASWITQLVRNGADLPTVSLLARHASVETTQTYYLELTDVENKRKGLQFLKPQPPRSEASVS